ncbi:hypothetical protein HOY34_10950 [Xinfangfangia sp. D13-10-4-6]|uniref:hypothetical protein n=1 Tax=Pseudogemmobacter hezensis TaxID=2737662 RepID=UPI0015532FA7|nr:hypothetical protein [Pseudogemmobacter hezensis]NPD15720.1 hypothetical protein [Pseudogemmobacter hezensis]
MRIVYHLGVHCTDEERLIRCLLKNRATLAAEGILVPAPTRYRRLLRDTAVQLRGAPANVETQALVLGQIMDDENASRMILSWDSFLAFPQWALRGRLYGFAGERIRAFTQIFPHIEASFFLAIRNPATWLPALYEKQKATRSFEEFIEGTDVTQLRWSDVVQQIIAENPDAPLTIWCDEDTPLIWPEVLQAVAGFKDDTVLADTDELLSMIMAGDGVARMRGYLASHPPASVSQRRRVVSAFLDKFGLSEQLNMEFSLPGWTQDTVDQLTMTYHEDIELIRSLPGVTLIGA